MFSICGHNVFDLGPRAVLAVLLLSTLQLLPSLL
jgi:hypothetical protein